METKSKSEITAHFIFDLNAALAENSFGVDKCEFMERKSGKMVRWTLQVQDPESKIDEYGVKWIKSPEQPKKGVQE